MRGGGAAGRDEILVWRVRAVATGTVRWSLDTAHHGFDTMGPCVIAPESGKVKLKGFGLKSKRVESGARVRAVGVALAAAAAPGSSEQAERARRAKRS